MIFSDLESTVSSAIYSDTVPQLMAGDFNCSADTFMEDLSGIQNEELATLRNSFGNFEVLPPDASTQGTWDDKGTTMAVRNLINKYDYILARNANPASVGERCTIGQSDHVPVIYNFEL